MVHSELPISVLFYDQAQHIFSPQRTAERSFPHPDPLTVFMSIII
jgi:hypothetical protein